MLKGVGRVDFTKYINLCKDTALSIDTSQRERLGAVVLDSKRKFVSVGTNNMSKTHTKAVRWYEWPYIHAEFSALMKSGRVEGGIVVVVRVGRRNNLLNSTPCPSCLQVMKEYGIREVVHIDCNNEVSKIRLY